MAAPATAPAVRPLNYRAAMRRLRPPLRFGDVSQIEAAHVVELVETIVGVAHLSITTTAAEPVVKCPVCNSAGYWTCPHCDGSGECSACGHECSKCDGAGIIRCPACKDGELYLAGLTVAHLDRITAPELAKLAQQLGIADTDMP